MEWRYRDHWYRRSSRRSPLPNMQFFTPNCASQTYFPAYSPPDRWRCTRTSRGFSELSLSVAKSHCQVSSSCGKTKNIICLQNPSCRTLSKLFETFHRTLKLAYIRPDTEQIFNAIHTLGVVFFFRKWIHSKHRSVG